MGKTKPAFGVVDYRLLLMAHPIFQNYDPEIRRFKDTASAFVGDKEATLKDLTEKAAELGKQIETLGQKGKKFLQNQSRRAKEAYSLYWKKRKFLEMQLEIIQKAIETVKIDGNYNQGRTSESTVVPVVQAIHESIMGICQDLKEKHGLTAIIDVSSLVQKIPDFPGPMIPTNLHRKFWEGQPVSPTEFKTWRRSCDRYIPLHFPDLSSFPLRGGFIDLRDEAASLLKTYADPSL